jgi:transcriptional regulator GlxA family with amidase domain
MKHISIVVPKGQYSIVNIAGSFQILHWANDFFFQQSRTRLFEIEFVGHASPAHDRDGFYTVTPPRTLQEVTQTDLIVIPAVHGDLREAIDMNREVIEWVKQQHAQGAEIAAFCIGAFLLAETGLLDGKTCSTHWGSAHELQQMFPNIKVQSEKIVTESEGLYSSGGAYAFTNLVVYLIEKYGGRELAILTAKAFMIDVDKNTQSVFTIFNGQKEHEDEMVLKVQAYIEEHFAERFTIEELAAQHASIRRTLERRFKACTGNSVLEYLQRVRIEAAKRLLEGEAGTISNAMYEVGYTDPKAFRELFKRLVGISPVAYKRKFTRVLVEA